MSRARIPIDVELRVRAAAGNCCGYCRCAQWLLNWELEIEHIISAVDARRYWVSAGWHPPKD